MQLSSALWDCKAPRGGPRGFAAFIAVFYSVVTMHGLRRATWRAREREPITAGSKGRAPGQGIRGRRPPEAESLLAFVRPREMANWLLSHTGAGYRTL